MTSAKEVQHFKETDENTYIKKGKNMQRILTVKGTGQIKKAPDQMEINLTLLSRGKEYAQTMDQAENAISKLEEALEKEGLVPGSLKTSNFSIDTEYESYQDEAGRYLQRFVGYLCEHRLTLRQPMDTSLLGRILDTVSRTKVNPRLQVRFTIADQEGMAKELLARASKDALEKATILADASGVTLGELQRVDYDWREVAYYSKTDYRIAEESLGHINEMEMTPEDLHVTDTVRFVWEIHS